MNRMICTVVVIVLLAAAAAVHGAEDPAPTRTLEAVTIEGAVDVPQVLFITSRENVRFDDGLGRTFLLPAADTAAGRILPTRLRPLDILRFFTQTGDLNAVDPAPPEAKE